jgi:hypothetical protein
MKRIRAMVIGMTLAIGIAGTAQASFPAQLSGASASASTGTGPTQPYGFWRGVLFVRRWVWDAQQGQMVINSQTLHDVFGGSYSDCRANMFSAMTPLIQANPYANIGFYMDCQYYYGLPSKVPPVD